jgi:hypothetical protein
LKRTRPFNRWVVDSPFDGILTPDENVFIVAARSHAAQSPTFPAGIVITPETALCLAVNARGARERIAAVPRGYPANR